MSFAPPSHTLVTTSTVGEIRRGGGDVIPTLGASPFAAVIIGIRVSVDESADRDAHPVEKKEPDLIRLFADFQNATPSGRVRLNTVGTFKDIERLSIELKEGMQVVIEDRDSLIADATVRWEAGEGWVAEVDWDRIEDLDDARGVEKRSDN